MNQGRELLAGPVRLELRAGGKVQALVSTAFKLAEKKPGHVRIEASQEAAGVRIRGTNVCEFDGFAWISSSSRSAKQWRWTGWTW